MLDDPREKILVERVHKDHGPCLPVCTCIPRIRSILKELDNYYDGYAYRKGREDERAHRQSAIISGLSESEFTPTDQDIAFDRAINDLIDIGAIIVIDPSEQN